MNISPIHYLDLKDSIYLKSNDEIEFMIHEAKLEIQKSEHDDVAHKIAKLDYTLMIMSIRDLKHQDFD